MRCWRLIAGLLIANGALGQSSPGGNAYVPTQLIAGSNITLSPTNGLGKVTINALGGGSGSVSSVGFFDGSTVPIFTISGTPVTTTGTLTETLATQSANTIFAGPTTGSAAQPAFRALVSADIPNNAANTSGNATTATTATNLAGGATGSIPYQSAANTSTFLADVAVGSYLRSGGVTTAPVWSTVTIPNAAMTGDLWYGSAASTIAALSGNITSTKNFLVQTGNGTISAAPSWGTIAAGDVPTLNQNTTGTSGGLTGTPAISVSTLSTSGLYTANLGITATGATLNFNASSNFGTNVNTGTSTGNVAIGNNTSITAAQTTTFSGADIFTYGTGYSAGTWGLTSPLWNVTALTMNDTTASGTVTNDAAMTIQAVNFTSTGGASTTLTNPATLYIAAPTCTTVVCTNGPFSLYLAGNLKVTAGVAFTGGVVSINASSNNVTNINTGTTTSAVHIADGSGNNTIGIGNGTGVVTFASPVTMSNATVKLTGLASSSAATTGTVCWTTGNNALTVDTTLACLSSTRKIKENIEPIDIGLEQVMALRPVSYDLKPAFNPTHLGPQVGLIAEEVQEVDPRLVGLDSNGEVKGVRYMQMVALLVRGMQEQEEQIKTLKAEVAALKSLH